jgi:pantoate--beta-alanine ligase
MWLGLRHYLAVAHCSRSRSRWLSTEHPRIAVVGGGALGTLLTAKLAIPAPQPVVLVTDWAAHRRVIAAEGVRCDGAQVRNIHPLSYADLTGPAAPAPHSFDLVMVLTKSWNTDKALQAADLLVKKAASDRGTIVLIQNGVGYLEPLPQLTDIKKMNLIFGVTSIGALLRGSGAVQQTGTGATVLFDGSCHNEANHEALIRLLQRAGLDVSFEPHAEQAKQLVWRKLFVNAVINPLTAVTGVRNGELLTRPAHRRLLDALLAEYGQLAGELGTAIPLSVSASTLTAIVHDVLAKTAPNKSSMLCDIERGTATEYDEICTPLLQLATTTPHPMRLARSLGQLLQVMSSARVSAGEPAAVPSRSPLPPQVFTTIAGFREWRRLLAPGTSVGFVPTMGALHAGHLNLFRRAQAECDVVVGSIFVNPSQFAQHEDLSKYPRPFEQDIAALSQAQCADAVFAPVAAEMYPALSEQALTRGASLQDSFQPIMVVPFEIDRVSLEARSRPQFFRGVATVCTKLFNIVQPTQAFFGQKDAVQSILLRNLARDLNIPVDIVIVETTREPDGLAMSSRNVYLSPADRALAPIIYQSLHRVKDAFEHGERHVGALKGLLQSSLCQDPRVVFDYASIADNNTAAEWADEALLPTHADILISTAIKLGTTRLIDNIVIRAAPSASTSP